MKLLYLSGSLAVSTSSESSTTGARAHILGVMHGFESHGWTVQSFIFGNSFMKLRRAQVAQQSLHKSTVSKILADILRILFNFTNGYLIYFRHRDVDLVYERSGGFQSLGARFKKNGIPWILETNCIHFLEANRDRNVLFFLSLCRRSELKAYRNCDLLVCVTEKLKEMLVKTFQIDPGKILVVPNGVDGERFNPEYSKPIRLSKDLTIGFVGLLMEWCGLDLLMEALLRLPAATRPKVVVVGDGAAEEHFRKNAYQMGLSNFFTFMGKRPWEEIPNLIAGFDLCYSGQIRTKSGEMYLSPLKLYEYLAMGKPVIASRFQDAKSLIVEAENGFLFEPENSESLAKAIRRAILILETRGFDSEKIREPILLQHSWQARVKLIIDRANTIRGILSNGPRSDQSTESIRKR